MFTRAEAEAGSMKKRFPEPEPPQNMTARNPDYSFTWFEVSKKYCSLIVERIKRGSLISCIEHTYIISISFINIPKILNIEW